MKKSVTATITVSSDPRFDTRYFIDLRDTTHASETRQARQMLVQHFDKPEALKWIEEMRVAAEKAGVAFTAIDKTGEVL